MGNNDVGCFDLQWRGLKRGKALGTLDTRSLVQFNRKRGGMSFMETKGVVHLRSNQEGNVSDATA